MVVGGEGASGGLGRWMLRSALYCGWSAVLGWGGGRGAATPISIKVVFVVVHRVASPQSRASQRQPWKVSMRSTLTC